MRIPFMLVWILVTLPSARAEILSARAPVSCGLVMEALGVGVGETKRVPLYELGSVGLKLFGGKRILVFGHVADPITTERRWIYAHVGARRPIRIGLPKIKVSKNFLDEDGRPVENFGGVKIAWADALPWVKSVIVPDTLPMPIHERRLIGRGTILRDRRGFYIIANEPVSAEAESLDVFAFGDLPSPGERGSRQMLSVDPKLSEFRLVGQATVDDVGLVSDARFLTPLPAAKTGELIDHPSSLEIELRRWSVVP